MTFIQLLPARLAHIRAIRESPARFKDLFGIEVADGFTHFPEALDFMEQILAETAPPETEANRSATESEKTGAWWAYFPVLHPENKVIGTCGFKGAPNEAGEVELGYEVADAYQNRGFATDMTAQLVAVAFADEQVQTVVAHTLAERNASCRVLEKNGFVFVSAAHDPDDGDIWRWELTR